MTQITHVHELAAAADPTGQAIVAGVKGADGEHHFVMHVDDARRFVHALLTAINQAEANQADKPENALRGPLLPLSQWTVMPSHPQPHQMTLQMRGAGLLANYPLEPDDARELAKGLWSGADRTDGGAAAVQ